MVRSTARFVRESNSETQVNFDDAWCDRVELLPNWELNASSKMFQSGRHVHLRKAASAAARRNRAQKLYRSSLAVHDAPRSRRPSSIVYGALATAGLASAYFFWPDASRAAPTYDSAILSPVHFTPTTLVACEACPDTETRLLTLKLPPQSIPSREENTFAPIWSVFIKDDDIQVERPYTPLEGIDEEGCMKLWIKRYPKGEVGRWLHSKNVNDKIEIRGPVKTWPWQEDQWDEVIMVKPHHSPTVSVPKNYDFVLRYREAQGSRHFTSSCITQR